MRGTIDNVALFHVRMPLANHFETSFGRQFTRDCVIVEIAADGLVGYGECVTDREPRYGYENVGTALHVLEAFLVPALFDARDVSVDGYRDAVTHVRGHEMAKAGLEMALWDLEGKRQGRSLASLFGGERSRVEVGVSVGIQDSVEDLLEVINRYLGDGYQRIKIKIKPGRDVTDTTAVRRAFPGLKLQVDANSAYTLDNAVALRPLDELDLLLIEQPLAEDDLWDHHILQRDLKTALCLDESIRAPRHARQALEMEACRIINIKQGRVGGLSSATAIHDLCSDLGVPVWCGGMLETGIGRAANLALASLPGFRLPGDISATARYYERDITEEQFELNTDSTISVPENPGLGVEIDPDALERFAVTKKTMRKGSG